jgi:hypothetical protein
VRRELEVKSKYPPLAEVARSVGGGHLKRNSKKILKTHIFQITLNFKVTDT